MRCLLVGEYYSENLGDGVLCKSTEILLREIFPNIEIDVWDLSGRCGFNKDAVADKKWKVKWKAFSYSILESLGFMDVYLTYRKKRKCGKNKFKSHDYDFIIFAGGQIAVSGFKERVLYILDKFKDIPKVFNAIGNGNDNVTWIDDDICEKYNIKGITYRDGTISLKNVMCKETFDTAIISNELIKKNSKDNFIEESVVGIGVMYVPNIDKEIQNKFWKNVFEILNELNINYKIFTNGDPNDYDYAISLCKMYGISNSKLCARPITPEDLVKLIASFCCILGSRLHSNIIAYSMCVPSVGVVWDKKVSRFFEKVSACERLVKFNLDKTVIKKIINDLIQIKYRMKCVEANKQLVRKNFRELIEVLGL